LVRGSQSSVERGPKHPKKNGANHGKHVGRLGRTIFKIVDDFAGRLVHFGSRDDPTQPQAKEGTKCMDKDGTTHVDGGETTGTNSFVDAIKDQLKESDQQHLQW